jgi:hypothetical protein
MRHWGLVPLFVFLLVITCVFELVFVIGSTTVSDMCINSPDPRMTAALNEIGGFERSIIYEFAVYYINRCIGKGPLGFQNQINTFFEVGEFAFNVTKELATVSNEILAVLCRADSDPGPIQTSARAIQGTLCNLGQSLAGLNNFFACQTWRPLYTQVSVEHRGTNHAIFGSSHSSHFFNADHLSNCVLQRDGWILLDSCLHVNHYHPCVDHVDSSRRFQRGEGGG